MQQHHLVCEGKLFWLSAAQKVAAQCCAQISADTTVACRPTRPQPADDLAPC